MHSRIIQLSKTPIEREDWKVPSDYYENSEDFADYIGDMYPTEERQETIEWLAEAFDGILELDGETLIYRGLGDFKEKWVDHIKALASDLKVDDNIFEMDFQMYKISAATKKTHLGLNSRFLIEDWNGVPGPCGDLISWLDINLKDGDRIHVGSVIDFHF